MMRIAYVSLDPGIPVWGSKGASVHIQSMIRAFMGLGAKVTVFTPRPEGARPPGFENVQVVTTPLPDSLDAQERALAQIELDRRIPALIAGAGPYDMIYERHALFSCNAMETARNSGIAGVLEVNAPLIDEQTRHRILPLPDEARKSTDHAMMAARLVSVVSPAVGDYVRAHGAWQVLQMPNAIDPLDLPVSCEDRDGFTVGFVGSMKPWHDLDVLISAMELLDSALRTRLLIVGDGPERARLAPRLDALQAEVTGLLPHHEVPARLISMDVGIAPYSARQDFYFSPLKIYEYMAAGLPVIASAVGNLPEVVTHDRTGLIVPPDNPQALANAITQLARDRAYGIRLGSAGRKHVEAKHTWHENARHILRLSGLLKEDAT
ncbi:MAG: glycosyltransferase family 4 protein [Paracoccus sp. (in: a-proteobacteria)]